MAYSSKLTPMNGQRPHDGYYGPAQRGYGPTRAHGNERRREPPEPSYSPHAQYAEHDQSSWSPQEQYSNGDRGYEPSQRGWQNGRFYSEPSHQKLRTAAPRDGNEQRNRPPRTFPGSQVQGEDYGQNYDNYNSGHNHEQTHHQPREEPRRRYQESQDHQHDGTGFGPRQRPAPMPNPRPPRNDSSMKYGFEEDQLPRYLDHTESRQGTDGGAQHHRNDFSRSPKPPPSSHARPIDPRSASSSPSRQKRILGDLKSPETLSWDNPFPTFPPKFKKSNQGKANSVHSSTPPTSLNATKPQSKSHGSRPPTASSQDSLNSFHNHKAPMNHAESSRHLNPAPRASGDSARSPNYQLDGPSDGALHSFPESGSTREPAYDRPVSRDKAYDHGRAVQTSQLAHSIHRPPNTRPEAKAPSSGAPGPAYQRSQTMPAALSDITPDPGLIPVDEPSWPEPGAVSGYYGPQDKGYLPHDSDSGFQSGQLGPSRTYSEKSRWEGAARPTQVSQPAQRKIHEERRAEFFDSHEEPQSTELPYRKLSDRFGRSVSNDEEMPNFESLHNTRRYDQQSTFDDHLQAGGTSHRPPPMPAHSDPYTQHHFSSKTSTGHQLPRSRSQPDFNEYGSIQGQENNGFNFGLLSATDRRPATSANADVHAESSTRAPNRRQQDPPHIPDPNSRSRSGRDRIGPIPGPDYGGDERPRGSDPRHMASRAPQSNHPRSRPTQYGTYPDNRSGQPRGTPTPQNSGAPMSSPDKPLPNPNALPHHPNPNSLPHQPAPVRQGNELRSNQAPRPPPVRTYNSPPTDPVQQSTSSRSGDGLHAGSVTPKELESLRQKTIRNPNDSPSQFELAKKLVEASEVLVDQRADPATRKRNHDKYQADALKIIRKLSALSYPEADFYYADCYSRGALGLQNDIKEAFILYQKAAKANHAQAAYRVAVCCELGQEEGGGTKRDPVKAMQWYKRAATLGDVAAMYKLGVIQLKGLLGQPRDVREAMSWLRKAADKADKENPHALHELALLHEKPMAIDGVQHDEAASRRYFTQAANLGYKFSQFRLGCAYEYGLLGCNVDPRQSIAWYSKAAVQEEHQSELALSGWYLTGTEGVLQQSDTEAYLWARKAAQAGLAKAEYAMGYFTEVGIGAPANLEDAKRWYWKSASQNFPKARDRLEDLRRGGGARQKTRVSRSNMKKQSDGECIVM